MNAVRKAVGIEKKQTVTDQLLDESCPKLSYNQRLTGYVLCMSVGFLLTIGSLVRLKALLHGDPAPFVIYFTFGNLCAIASCFFLSGPKSHCKKMVDRTRRIATAFYLITIFFTFFVVFYDKIPDDGRVGIIIGERQAPGLTQGPASLGHAAWAILAVPQQSPFAARSQNPKKSI